MNTIMESHNDGEVWGLAIDDQNIFTVGDDNQVKKWDPFSRKSVETGKITDNENNAKDGQRGASTMGKHPESQMGRALAISVNGDLCICACDGNSYIRNTSDLHTDIAVLDHSTRWIEVAEYSPDGSLLAVGSHDTNIYIYDVNDGYSLRGKCSEHNASITCIDFSMDG